MNHTESKFQRMMLGYIPVSYNNSDNRQVNLDFAKECTFKYKYYNRFHTSKVCGILKFLRALPYFSVVNSTKDVLQLSVEHASRVRGFTVYVLDVNKYRIIITVINRWKLRRYYIS